MSLKDRLFDRIEKERSPWQRYQGPYGGDGWVNVRTGEVRYQESKPDPGEGMPDDPDAYGAGSVEAEPGEPVESVPDDFGPVDMDLIDEGDPVILDDDALDDPVAAEVMEMEGDKVLVEGPDGESYLAHGEDIKGAPAQPPPDGLADGWQAQPDTISEDTIERGQLIEVYDADADEYVLAEATFVADGAMDARVTETDDWDLPEDSKFADGDQLPLGDEYDNDLFITAAEDPDYYEMDLGDPIESDEELLEAGDEVWVKHGTLTEEPVVGKVTEDDHGRLSVQFESDDGKDRHFTPELHGWDADMIETWEKPGEMLSGEEFREEFLMATDKGGYDLLDGHQMRVNHPVFGDVEGEVETGYDEQGHLWLSVIEDKEPEVGEMVDFEDPSYGYDSEGEIVDIEGDTAIVDDVPEQDMVDEIEVPLENIEATGEEYAVTLNPDSPLSLQSATHEVEDPTQTIFDPADELKTGDYVEYGDGVEEVQDTAEGGEGIYLEHSGWVDAGDIDQSSGIVQESLEPPADAPQPEWSEMPESKDHGLAAGDWLYYHDPEANEMKRGQVDDVDNDNEVVVDGETVHRDEMQGFVSSLPQNVTTPQYIESGEYVEYMDTNREVHEGIVTSSGGTGQNQYLKVVGPNGETERINPNQGSHALVGYEEDYSGTLGAEDPAIEVEDGKVVDERPTEEVVDDLTASVDLSQRDGRGRLEKARHLAKTEKKKLKNAMYSHFGVQPVESFYSMKSSWKSNSGSHKDAETLERAYKQALGVQAQARENGGRDPTPEEVKLAETVATLSQDYFQELYGESTNLKRGASNTAWETFADSFLSEPHRDEYRLNFLAQNNHSLDKSTADKWNAFTVDREVDADSVLSMTDFLFETSYEGETEIGVMGDEQTTKLEGIYPGHSDHGEREAAMHADIEQWDEDLTGNFFASMAQSTGVFDYNSLSHGQMANLKRIVEKTYEYETPKQVNDAVANEIETARQALRENGFEFDWEQSSQWGVEDFEGLGDVTGYEPGEGVPVEYWDEHRNEKVTGEAMGVHGDEVMVWDEQGVEQGVTPANLTFVDETDLENLQDRAGRITPDEMVGEYITDIDDLKPLDQVYYAFSPNSEEVKEGKVLDIDGDTVEISGPMGQTEYFDAQEVADGHVVPQDEVESADGTDGSADSDGGDFQNVEDFDDGMAVEYDTGTSQGTGEVQYTTDDWVYVEDDHGEMHTMHPDDLTVENDAAGGSGPAVTVGDTIEVPVPDNIEWEGGAASDVEVSEVEPDGSVKVPYDDIPWLEDHPEEFVNDTVSVKPEQYDTVTDESGGSDDGLAFEAGEQVHLDNGYPSGHPDHIDEIGELAEPVDHDGQTIFPVLDESGTVINEYTPQELADLAEPAPDDADLGGTDESDDSPPEPAEVDTDTLSAGETFQMDTVSGVKDFEVVEVSGDPNYPPKVQEQEYGNEFLLWDDGELEPL